MKRFREKLLEIEGKLDLPQPEKSRILLEIGSDMEDAFEHLLEHYSEEEAEREVMKRFDISDGALAELVSLHDTFFRKVLRRISAQANSRWERILLTVTIISVISYSGRELLSTEIFAGSSLFVWPIAAASAVTLAASIYNFYRLYLKKDHYIKTLRKGLPVLIASGGVTILIGFYGTLYELNRTMAKIIMDTEKTMIYLMRWAMECSSMMIICLLSSIAAGLLWYIFMNKVGKIEIAEASWLFENR